MKAALSLAALAAAGAAAAMLCPACPAEAQANERIARLIVYGKDPCPRSSSGDEIVVCARRPETERYRIPKELRDDAPGEDPESTSWAQRAQSLEYVGRTGIQSCSTVGPGGVTGCWAELMRAARNDRRVGDDPGR
ncbi:MAG TPA: hypothetical protein VGB59_12505 [Allosphingosinicella sp.]|jgi:hypothetical protein